MISSLHRKYYKKIIMKVTFTPKYTINMRFLKSQILLRLANSFFIDSPQPSNLSYLWNFGSLLGLCLVFQILTGIFLAMNLCVAVKSHYMLETSKALITILVFFFQTLAFDGK